MLSNCHCLGATEYAYLLFPVNIKQTSIKGLSKFCERHCSEVSTQCKKLHQICSDFVYTYGESRDATLSTAETGGVTVETGIKNSIQSLETSLNDNGNMYSYLSTHNIKYFLCTVKKLLVSMSNYKGNKFTVIMLMTLLTLQCTRSHIFNVFCYLLIISKVFQKSFSSSWN